MDIEQEERRREDGSLLSEIIFLGTGCAYVSCVDVVCVCERMCLMQSCARALCAYGRVTAINDIVNT